MNARPRKRLVLVLSLAFAALLAALVVSCRLPDGAELEDPCHADVEIPTGENPRTWIDFLTRPELAGRRAGTQGSAEVGRALATRVRELGGPAGRVRCRSFPLLGRSEFTVEADLPFLGEPSVRLLVAAHYDGQGLHPTRGPLPGADDNASGVAALLGAARSLASDPPRGVAVHLVFFGAEELGGRGSLFYIRELQDETRPDAALVLDMVGRPLPWGETGAGFGIRVDDPELASGLVEVAANLGVPIVPMAELGDAAPGFSDDRHLRSAGLAVALLSSGLHDDYHATGDLPEKVDLGQVRWAARLVEAWVRSYERYTPRP